MAVGEENCGHRDATDAALEIKGPAGAIAVGRVPDVPAACAALALSRASLPDPAGELQGGIGMRDAAVLAEFCKSERIFRARDHGGCVAKQGPAPRDGGEQVLPILKPSAADDPGRLSRASEALERRDDSVRAHAAGKTLVETDMGLSCRGGVFIPEEIGDQRRISAAARGRGKSAAGSGCDQHCCGPIHLTRARAGMHCGNRRSPVSSRRSCA